MVSLTKRNTTTNIVGSIQNDLDTSTGTGATLTYNALGATRIWGSIATGNTDWTGGTYTWRYRVVTANSTITLTQVRLIRYASDGTTIRASKSSGAISVSLGTTGVKSGTISWNDGTQNPAGRASSDLFAIEFTTTSSGHGTQNVGIGTNLGSTNDEIDTPLTITQTFNGDITESSISVNETLDRLQNLNTSINESTINIDQTLDRIQEIIRTITEGGISEDDSVSGTFESGGSTGQTFDVSLVEFPETVIDELTVIAGVAQTLREITEDAITVNQTLNVIKNASRSIAEDTDIEETLIRILSALRSPTEDAITINQTLDGIKNALRSISEDPITINQTLDRILTSLRSISESVDIDDSVAGLLLRVRLITEDAITVNQTLERLLLATRSPSETVEINQTLTRVLTSLRSITEDTIDSNETLVRVYSAVRSITEDIIEITDSLLRVLQALRSASDDTDIDDSLAGFREGISRSIEETVTINDNLARLLSSIRSLNQTTTSDESLTGNLTAPRSITEDGITTDDVVTSLNIIVRQISEANIDINEVLERLLSSIRSLPETAIEVDEILAKSAVYPASMSEDPLNIDDSLVKTLTAIRSLIINVSVAETLTKIYSTSREINEANIAIDDALTALFIEFGGAIKLAGGYPDKSKLEIAQILINLLKQEWSNQ